MRALIYVLFFQQIKTYYLFIYFSGLLDALAKGLLSDAHVIGARILATNITTGQLATSVWWEKQIGGIGGPNRVNQEGVTVGSKPDVNYPW